MALTATVRRFELSLSDTDREVYGELSLRAAQHPSETERYLVARILARALEHADGVDFGRGLSEAEEPAIWQRDLRGDPLAWIEVGSPSVERLHKASKTGARIVVYTYKGGRELARAIAEYPVHRKEELTVFALDPNFLDAVAGRLDRVNRWDLAVSGGTLYLTIGGVLHEGVVERLVV